jgi:hypothetical protein
MSKSYQPDVTRVLTKMGRLEFGYRNFDAVSDSEAPTSSTTWLTAAAEWLEQTPGHDAVDLTRDASTAGAMFSLLGEAIPEAANMTVASGSSSEQAYAVTTPAAEPQPASPPTPHRLQTAPFFTTPADQPATAAVKSALPQPNARTSNPFPPRMAPPVLPATKGVTSMATVFRVLAHKGSAAPLSGGQRGCGSGFPFRRG